MLSTTLYTLAWIVLLPVALLRLLWRSRGEPGYRDGIAERLARYQAPESFRDAWWIHAVSVGETRAAQPLIEALLAREPEARVLLTQMTPTGRRTAESLYTRHGARIRLAYLPYDLPWLTRGFLDAFRPRAGILMETELWPQLMFAAQRRGLPLVLANARLSERSARRYARLGGFARRMFASLGAVAAQSPEDARRIAALGGRDVEVCGNLKFDVQPPASADELAAQLRGRIGSRRVVLAASTREGEESPLLQAFAEQAGPDELLLVVPRHPQRFDEVALLARRLGLGLQRRSETGPVLPQTQVLLGDSMGEMFAYFALADVAMIGGSWQPLGGQNLIEASAVGTPAIVGPHTYNFEQATRLAIEAGAALRADDERGGMAAALAVARDIPQRSRMSAAGLTFTAQHRGATAGTLAILDRVCGVDHAR